MQLGMRAPGNCTMALLTQANPASRAPKIANAPQAVCVQSQTVRFQLPAAAVLTLAAG